MAISNTHRPAPALITGFSPTVEHNVIGVVATFTNDDTIGPASNYTARVDWGDGVTSDGVVRGYNGNFTVEAISPHRYFGLPSHPFSVTVTNTTAIKGQPYRTVSSVLPVHPTLPNIAVTGNPGIFMDPGSGHPTIVGTLAGSVVPMNADPSVGTTDPNYLPVTLSGTVTVHDPSTGLDDDLPITFLPGTGNWLLQADLPGLPQGKHVGIIHDVKETGGGQSMVALPVDFNIYVGLSNGGYENAFAYGLVPLGEPSIPIAPGDTLVIDNVDYGDQTHDTHATISANPFADDSYVEDPLAQKPLAAFINHKYVDPGTYDVSVQAHDANNGVSLFGTAQMLILDQTLTSAANDIATDYNVSWSGVVATFQDNDPSPTPPQDHYTASIDWGDGLSDAHAAIGPGNTITGTHVYEQPGSYHTLVHIVDNYGGADTVTSGNVTVGPILTITTTANSAKGWPRRQSPLRPNLGQWRNAPSERLMMLGERHPTCKLRPFPKTAERC